MIWRCGSFLKMIWRRFRHELMLPHHDFSLRSMNWIASLFLCPAGQFMTVGQFMRVSAIHANGNSLLNLYFAILKFKIGTSLLFKHGINIIKPSILNDLTALPSWIDATASWFLASLHELNCNLNAPQRNSCRRQFMAKPIHATVRLQFIVETLFCNIEIQNRHFLAF